METWIIKIGKRAGVMVHILNPSIPEAEAGGSVFQSSLANTARPSPKKKKIKEIKVDGYEVLRCENRVSGDNDKRRKGDNHCPVSMGLTDYVGVTSRLSKNRVKRGVNTE
jgi:hypothetical protein